MLYALLIYLSWFIRSLGSVDLLCCIDLIGGAYLIYIQQATSIPSHAREVFDKLSLEVTWIFIPNTNRQYLDFYTYCIT
jgi:hypothetical protein